MARLPIWHVYIFEPVKVLHFGVYQQYNIDTLKQVQPTGWIIILTCALPHVCKPTLNINHAKLARQISRDSKSFMFLTTNHHIIRLLYLLYTEQITHGTVISHCSLNSDDWWQL